MTGSFAHAAAIATLASVLLWGCGKSSSGKPGTEVASANGGGGGTSSSTAGRGGGTSSSTAGRGSEGGAGGGSFAEASAALEHAIDEHSSNDFTLMLGNSSGVFFSHSKGDSSETTVYESASTSKWVTSAVILHLVDQVGDPSFSLQTAPQDLIDYWTTDPVDPRSQIELGELLAFLSGLQQDTVEIGCTLLGTGTIQTCVARIYADAAAQSTVPGETFFYGSNHLQVAGLMAMHQLDVDTWGEVFDGFTQDTGLFPTAAFDLPNLDNPRLAGGMHWTAAEYMGFLAALFNGQLLSEASAAAMFSDRTPEDSVTIAFSPAREGVAEDWHYGLGVWFECHEATWQSQCAAARRFSSPGAYGAYPFVDFGAGFYGILALQYSLGSFQDGHDLYDDLKPQIDRLVELAP